VWTPEGLGFEGGVEFFEGTVIGAAFDFASSDGDEATFDGSEDEIFGIYEEEALLRLDEDFGGLRTGLVVADLAELID
jgi:hypothetical protein